MGNFAAGFSSVMMGGGSAPPIMGYGSGGYGNGGYGGGGQFGIHRQQGYRQTEQILTREGGIIFSSGVTLVLSMEIIQRQNKEFGNFAVLVLDNR